MMTSTDYRAATLPRHIDDMRMVAIDPKRCGRFHPTNVVRMVIGLPVMFQLLP
ncbi:MAG: hypothetical protein IPP42_22930 [Saprospiraceae bacterium]|nr:hypothetical protein [Saprospiraceae bacterium]